MLLKSEKHEHGPFVSNTGQYIAYRAVWIELVAILRTLHKSKF